MAPFLFFSYLRENKLGLLTINLINKQEAFEKCWAHSPREPPHAHSAGAATGTVARRLRIDVHDNNNDDDNDNA